VQKFSDVSVKLGDEGEEERRFRRRFISFRILDARYRMQLALVRIQDTRYKIQITCHA